ncbi:FMRFamide related peptide family [Popillia japonica]|uniref:FMRFamide related peptide family n=1 Tax=Popillia japonica TaxID=7064 RepID=A0AAW1HSZ4_POPJA
MLISPIAALLLHIFLTTTVHAYSENAVYQPSRSKGEHLFFNLRSGVDSERSTIRKTRSTNLPEVKASISSSTSDRASILRDPRDVFSHRILSDSANPIRFGGRSDIPPLVGKAMEYEAMMDDELTSRERRAFNKGNHMRFGRANSNFLRFGRARSSNNNNRSSGYNNRLTRANNSLFMRFGRGRNDFLRFGRSSEELSRKKRDTSTGDDVEKRGNSNFMRFGKRYNYEEDLEEIPNFTEEQTKALEDALFLKLLSQISCNMESGNCDERLD